ncbi:MAG: hypothetical protein AB7W37_10605 [Syntrophobacteraceae bacterium]
MLHRLAGGDVTRRNAVLWEVEAATAAAWLRMQEEERRREVNRELSKMEFLARLLGSRWRAPYLEERGGWGGAGAGEGAKGRIGAYCAGASVEECSRLFGGRIGEICSSCPE